MALPVDALTEVARHEVHQLEKPGAAAFHRQLVKGDLSSEYDNEIRLWLEHLEDYEYA